MWVPCVGYVTFPIWSTTHRQHLGIVFTPTILYFKSHATLAYVDTQAECSVIYICTYDLYISFSQTTVAAPDYTHVGVAGPRTGTKASFCGSLEVTLSPNLKCDDRLSNDVSSLRQFVRSTSLALP